MLGGGDGWHFRLHLVLSWILFCLVLRRGSQGVAIFPQNKTNKVKSENCSPHHFLPNPPHSLSFFSHTPYQPQPSPPTPASKYCLLLTLFLGFSWFLIMESMQLWIKYARVRIPVRAGKLALNTEKNLHHYYYKTLYNYNHYIFNTRIIISSRIFENVTAK